MSLAPSSERAARAPIATDRLSERHFRQLARFVEQHAGIRMPNAKRTMAEGRLRKRVRALGLGSLDEYCGLMFEHGGIEGEVTHLINVVTTNKTEFFREPDHFDYLAQKIVPALLAEGKIGPKRPLKLWSAAASTGAEAYTVAMVLADLSSQGTTVPFAILGTDISTEVLEQARTAIYPFDMLESVPAELRRRYVMRPREAKRKEGRIVPELRKRTRFHSLNLMDPTYPFDQDVDVIFCRNVLIYFDKETQAAVLGRLMQHLRPGGHLFVGHSETATGTGLPLEPVAPAVFRRVQ